MKIEPLDKSDTAFKPVSIVFTFESQQELDAWGGLFNVPSFTEFMKEVSGSQDHCYAWKTLKNIGANLEGVTAARVFKVIQGVVLKL